VKDEAGQREQGHRNPAARESPFKTHDFQRESRCVAGDNNCDPNARRHERD
jgi:hypothetical protein